MSGLIVHIINYEAVLPVSSGKIPYATIQKKMLLHGVDGHEISRCRLGGVGFIPVKVFKIEDIIHISQRTLDLLSRKDNGHAFASRWEDLMKEANEVRRIFIIEKENEDKGTST